MKDPRWMEGDDIALDDCPEMIDPLDKKIERMWGDE